MLRSLACLVGLVPCLISLAPWPQASAPTSSAPRKPDSPRPAEAKGTWMNWRGPLQSGVAPDANPPLTFSETTHLRWKSALPGLGHSSPVVTEAQVFVTAAIPFGDPVDPRPETAPGAHHNLAVTQRQRSVAIALDRASGDIQWTRSLHEGFPAEGGHATGSYASASPVTDGRRLFAFFGSQGLYALDLAGELLWSRQLGTMRSKHGHGEGSSPALHGDTLVVNWDHEGDSFVVALDADTGAERWRRARPEVTSWASPIIIELEGTPQAVVSGTGRIRGYDLATGEVIWECGGLSHNVVATPVFFDGKLWAASSYEKQALVALDLHGARGDLTDGEHVLWYRRRATPYVPSPLLYDDALYVLHHYQGMLSRLDALTGAEPVRPLRIPGVRDVYASPVGAAGRIYITDRSGVIVVLSHSSPVRELARNQLNDRFSATPALAGDELFLRGERFLYCLTESR